MIGRAAALGTLLLPLLLVPAPSASAGGGCHARVTHGTGDTVQMRDACFTPTALRVDPGTSVTFVNEDPFVHNVTANLWGHFDDLEQGDAFTATFAQEGIYPYACTFHPEMTGVVVVGDGDGPGSGEAVVVSSLQEPPAPSPEVRTVTVTEEAGASSPLVWLSAGLGLLAGLAIGSLARGRRIRAEAGTG
jgi:plastocyanin